jgi:kumamolisin
MIYRPFLFLASTLVLVGASSAGGSPVSAARATFFSFATSKQILAGYNPAQIEAAYDFGPLLNQNIDGTGQTIALVELDTFNPADLQQFDAANQLPDVTVQQYYAGGQKFNVPVGGEATMDLEWAHALAPGARLQVYYLRNKQTNKAAWTSLGQTLKQAASNGAGTISLSFGACGASSGYTATQKALAAVLKQGVSVFVASGDTGAYPGTTRECGQQIGVGYPASDPSVAAVGGTTLLLNSDNSINQEVAWHLSGGGKGKPLLRPVWQLIPQLPHAKYRWVPDVSFLADPSTGVAIVYGGRWRQAGGTSLGAPAWAAIWALVREDGQQAGTPIQPAPKVVYQIGNSPSYSQAFHDITSGDNGYYQATAGWNPVTGWGTPDVAGLASTVLAMSTSGS